VTSTPTGACYTDRRSTLTARKLDLAKSVCFGDIWSSIREDLRELHDSDDYVTEKLNKQCYEDGPKAAARKHFRACMMATAAASTT